MRQQGQFYVRLVFVAIADNDRVALALDSDNGVQFGLRTGLNAQIELTAMGDNLLDDGLHLIDLNGEHYVVFRLIVILLGSFLKTAPRLLDTIVENVGKAQ